MVAPWLTIMKEEVGQKDTESTLLERLQAAEDDMSLFFEASKKEPLFSKEDLEQSSQNN